MTGLKGQTASSVWVNSLDLILRNGMLTYPRKFVCKEILNAHTTISMQYPIVTVPSRKLGYKFMYAEAYFILSGGNMVRDIAPYSKRISYFSDNGVTFFGAYGPKILDQLNYVIDSLIKDSWTRQAVLTIWRENPPASKDIPCTISAQFVIRHDQLHCIDNMRSSDAWLGWPYDVFNFSMLSSYIILEYYRRTGFKLDLGLLGVNLGSFHLYQTEWEKAEECCKGLQEDVFTYSPFDPILQFETTDGLMEFLFKMREQGVNNVSTR